MEDDSYMAFILFSDTIKIRNYIEDFRDYLQSSEKVISLNKIKVFSMFIRVLNRVDLYDDCKKLLGEDCQNFKTLFNDLLSDVFAIFCTKHIQIILQVDDVQNFEEKTIILDTIAELIKMFINEDISKLCITDLIGNSVNFLTEVKQKLAKYTVISESEMAPLFYSVLKFVAKVFQHKHVTDDYFSENDILTLIATLPLTDRTTVKLLVDYILPSIIVISKESFKIKIYESIWDKICLQYSLNERNSEEEFSVVYSCIYTLLCFLCECLFKNLDMYFVPAHAMFWKIIMSGLTSNFPFTRKKSLNILKTFLVLISNLVNEGEVVNNPIYLGFQKDLKIWNDVITLFESLEEKQIHVIKPVLPKFARILQLTTTKYTNVSDKSWEFTSSCILTALLGRMLTHETKFVVKWALSTILTIDFNMHNLAKNDDLLKLFLKFLLGAFNDQSLYSRNSEQYNYSLFLSSEKISVFLNNYISSLETEEKKVNFMNSLLETIATPSWCHVALMHVVFALTKLENLQSWNQHSLKFISKIVSDSQRSQETIFRTALEYFFFQCCSKFLDWKNLDTDFHLELLTVFNSPSVLRHSVPWDKFAFMFRKSEEAQQSIESIETSNNDTSAISGITKVEVGNERLARIALMLADTGVISPSNCIMDGSRLTWNNFLEPTISTLQLASKRPYMNTKDFFSAVKLISLLIKESHGYKEMQNDAHLTCILQCLQNCSEMIEFMYQMLFVATESSSYISQINILFDAFYVLTSEPRLKHLFINMIVPIREKIDDILEDLSMRRYLLFPLWKMLHNIMFEAEPEQNKHNLLLINLFHMLSYKIMKKVTSENILFECLSKPTCQDGVDREQWLQFSYDAVCYFWDISAFAIQHLDSDQFSDLAFLLAEESKKMFDNGPKLVVPHVIRCLKFVVPKLGLLDLSTMSELLEATWSACMELRGSDAFRTALVPFIEVIFQTEMLSDNFCDVLYKYIDRFKVLSDNTAGIFYNVIKQFCDSFPENFIHSKFDCVQLFVYALTFGPIHQKAHKIMEETLIYMMEQDSEFAESLVFCENNKPSSYVRMTAVSHLLKNLNGNENFLFVIIMQLLNVDVDENGKQSSHFANSFSHRIRNRAWQGILLLQKCISKESLNEQLLMKTLDTLGTENQQPSVRYLQEWVIFNILQTHSNILQKYILLLEQSLERRPSYIISALSVTNLLILHHVLINESDILRCFKLITILCMAQNFTVRLYAQMGLVNLFSLCQEKKIGSGAFQYEFVSQLIQMQQSLAGQGNFFRNVVKLSNDFYFSVFNPSTHFTFETIFYELPRLTNLCPDEWVKPSLFQNDCNVPIHNPTDDLKNSVPTSWTYKSENETPKIEDNTLDYNFQKKIIPIKDMLNDFEELKLVDNANKSSCKGGLIVVASLIDRIPNLGGLCRTCEVFAVSEFVIGSMRYTEDRQFQTLAVSADKWVSIKEVKPHQLKDYLISMKEKGYVLIGAEQTEDSCTLSEYKFPKKSVLLLGHEKEGLSVDLIQLLDVCVEIPQQGVVRSLNVHVSGAILIWEYARQHIKST